MLHSCHLADRHFETAVRGDRAGIDEVEPFGLDHPLQRTECGGREERIAPAGEFVAESHAQPADQLDPFVGQEGASDRRQSSCQQQGGLRQTIVDLGIALDRLNRYNRRLYRILLRRH